MKLVITEEEREIIRNSHNLGLLNENLNISGRNSVINPDGTVTINDRNGRPQKIRMSTKLGDINVIKIAPSSGGYNITGKSGMTEFVGNDKIGQILSFVDSGSAEIDSGSWSKPNVLLRKV